MAVRPEVRRRPGGGAARAAVPPGRVGARRDLPRGAALGRSRPVLPDQGARGPPAARNPLSARCLPHRCSSDRFGTNTAQSRHTSPPSVGSWACSGWCCRHAARDAASPETRSARGASRRSSGSARRCASDAAAPAHGRCGGASNARGGGSASRRRGPRSSTTDVTRPLVSAWKERGRRDLVEPFAALVEEVVAPPFVDAVTFVPGDRERGRDRGHVPVARLAHALADRWGLPVVRLLARSGPSSRQAGLSRADRRANVRDLFVARREALGTARARRRRLHDGGDRSRLRDDPAAGRSAVGRGRLPGAGRALALAYWTDDEEVPCDSRSPCGVDT